MDQREGDTVNNPQHFMAIMQVLGEAFLQPDISLFKQSLEILDNLNKKCKLYEKMISKCEMLTSHQRERLQENLGNNTDLPTFVQSLTMIVSDLRYYQLCNNSLPPGVISFD
ncbi:uncharacterized protein TRIADDRAFT_53770 [Trichoplax adhaerens]|uniref:Uncharacterized protein n=1 Tax=Trichoplax adhaerens TaxID=10228 RepID=B3RQ43_TRIAD|nr:hypothetical protein TRIADDRAFT_53770 [Trichoplax adhaerens]EDV27754.1 hypothetical protein TRIADDRAFT_53770 [Trichoplax adhaerens]|eukprot:XP_002109588.1 hypothetical protein TRIADDRAFT_53770 [Trichoplax adhaerens]